MTKSSLFSSCSLKPDNRNHIEFDEKNNIFRAGDETTALPSDDDIKLVDPDAVPGVRRLYKYMYAMGKSSKVMYGQENNLQCKAGSLPTHSDTFDMTGDYPSVQAFDVLSFTGVEFNVNKFNKNFTGQLPGWPAMEPVSEELNPVDADIEAAARMARRAIELGSIFTLSAHMPNFLFSKLRSDYKEGVSPAYGKYDYHEYTPNNLKGETVRCLLSKGDGFDAFIRYLDIVAEFAKRVGLPIIFRPLHENTGNWFWWGTSCCAPEEFKNLWQFIVRYLRDEKGIHNLLYSYSPGSENKSVAEYGDRYPGDDFVDLVGVDMYDPFTEDGKGEIFFNSMKHQLGILDEFSSAHNKLMAITETGLASRKPDPDCHGTAMHLYGNLNKNWHLDVLNTVAASNASYFLLWANFGRHSSIYAPFVEGINPDGSLYGHEMLENFIRYYNDEKTVFANAQKDALKSVMW